MRPIHRLAIAAILLHCTTLTAEDLTAQRPRLEITDVLPLPSMAEIEAPMDMSTTRRGGILVADLGASAVFEFDSAGRLVRRIGRSGEGPGEFRSLYRVTETGDGHILAYDHGTKEISTFAPDGRFVRRARLPHWFVQVDRILAVTPDTIIIVGVSTSASYAGRNSGVHVFDKDFAHIRSFGPLAPVRNEGTRRLWGTGNASLDRQGRLTYSLRQPYTILRYRLDGTQVDSLTVAMDLGPGPDSLVTITPAGRGARYHLNNDVDVVRITGSYWLRGGLYLAGRASRVIKRVDLIDAAGNLLSEAALPVTVQGCQAFNAETMSLWCIGQLQDEPRVFRLRVQVRE